MTHAMEAYFNDIVDAVCKTVRFDSSLKPAEEGCPFGKETGRLPQLLPLPRKGNGL